MMPSAPHRNECRRTLLLYATSALRVNKWNLRFNIRWRAAASYLLGAKALLFICSQVPSLAAGSP